MVEYTEGFYRRPLPESCIAFSSAEGRQIFREALELGGMAGYFAIAEQFHTQTEPAFCGLGTMVVVLNALAIDPGRIWRGVWRWYGEEMLDCCQSLSVIQETGITLDEFVCISRCNGAQVTAHRYDESSLEEFRQAVHQAAATPQGLHAVVAYSRRVLGQTGDGHFSPIGGYHPARDLVLLLDVARFKYPPHWVPLPLLWQAFAPLDPQTNRSRGYILLQKTEELYETFFHVALNPQQWRRMAAPYFTEKLPSLLERCDSPSDVVATLIPHLPVEFTTLLRTSVHTLQIPLELRAAIQAHSLFSVVQQVLSYQNGSESAIAQPWGVPNQGRHLVSEKTDFAEWLTILLLTCPPTLYQALKPDLKIWFDQVRNPAQFPQALNREVARLQEQMSALQEFCQRGMSHPL